MQQIGLNISSKAKVNTLALELIFRRTAGENSFQ